MKHITLILLLLISRIGNAQSTHVYATLQDYRDGKYFTLDSAVKTTRTQRDIGWNGGNTFKISCPNDSLNQELKKSLWAVMFNDTLYLNGMTLMRRQWYARALYTTNRFIYFRACEGSGELSASKLDAATAGALLGPFGAMGAMSAAKKRYNYILYLDSGEVAFLDKKQMKKLLESYPALLESFLQEKDCNASKVILKYLRQIE